MALAEAYSPASRQRAGAFGLSAGVAMDLLLGCEVGQRTDQVKAEKRLSDEKPHMLILSLVCLTSVDSEENVRPACKVTGFMTHDEYIVKAVNRHCLLDTITSSRRVAERGQSQQWRLGRLWRSWSCCRSLPTMMVIKSSETEALDCL